MFLPLKALFFGVYKVDIFVSTFVNFVNFVVGLTCILVFGLLPVPCSSIILIYFRLSRSDNGSLSSPADNLVIFRK